MLPSFIFLSNSCSQYQLKVQKITQINRFEHHIKQKHSQQLFKLSINENFIDSSLISGFSHKEQMQKLIEQITKKQEFDTIVVAPLRKSLQTSYQLFKKLVQGKQINHKIYFYIQPLLADRFNSTSSISNINKIQNSQQYINYKKIFQNFNILQNSQWMKDTLPLRIRQQLDPSQPNLSQAYFDFFKADKSSNKQKSFQTQIQFIERIKVLKQSLIQYQNVSGTNKKVLIIASADLLNYLAATDFHENGNPVNPLRMEPGAYDIVSIIVDGINTYKNLEFQSILPFCR